MEKGPQQVCFVGAGASLSPDIGGLMKVLAEDALGLLLPRGATPGTGREPAPPCPRDPCHQSLALSLEMHGWASL